MALSLPPSRLLVCAGHSPPCQGPYLQAGAGVCTQGPPAWDRPWDMACRGWEPGRISQGPQPVNTGHTPLLTQLSSTSETGVRAGGLVLCEQLRGFPVPRSAGPVLSPGLAVPGDEDGAGQRPGPKLWAGPWTDVGGNSSSAAPLGASSQLKGLLLAVVFAVFQLLQDVVQHHRPLFLRGRVEVLGRLPPQRL